MMHVLQNIVEEHENRIAVRRIQMEKKRHLRLESDPDNIGPHVFFQHYR